MKIKILKLEIDKEIEDKLFSLICYFVDTPKHKLDIDMKIDYDLEIIRNDLYGIGKLINFKFNEQLSVQCNVELYCDYSEADENNQSELLDCFMMSSKFKLHFYSDGQEIEVVRNQSTNALEDRFEAHYKGNHIEI